MNSTQPFCLHFQQLPNKCVQQYQTNKERSIGPLRFLRTEGELNRSTYNLYYYSLIHHLFEGTEGVLEWRVFIPKLTINSRWKTMVILIYHKEWYNWLLLSVLTYLLKKSTSLMCPKVTLPNHVDSVSSVRKRVVCCIFCPKAYSWLGVVLDERIIVGSRVKCTAAKEIKLLGILYEWHPNSWHRKKDLGILRIQISPYSSFWISSYTIIN